MTTKEHEIKLFCEGCMIEAEINTDDDRKIRLVSTSKGERYKLVYHRNEHNMFVIHSIVKM